MADARSCGTGSPRIVSAVHSGMPSSGKVISVYGDLVEALAILARPEEGKLIGIDGPPGVGKSVLAKALARDLAIERISLDSYLTREGLGYLEKLDFHQLGSDLLERRPVPKSRVLDGVLLLEVLERLELSPDILVYLRLISRSGAVRDIGLLDPTITEEELIQKTERMPGGESAAAALDRDIARYHKRCRPHERADFLFDRREE